jgi:glycosyltransferase involved in cell wall biosynthesis
MLLDKVTICVPCYNSESTIAATLDSLLTQSSKNLEIIVSDNHSTDKTIKIVREYFEKGVKLVTCPKLPSKTGSILDNCYSAIQNWNSLIELSNSKYIGIFHSDDIYSENIISRQLEIFQENQECSAVFSNLQYIKQNDKLSPSLMRKKVVHKNKDYLYLNQPQLVDLLLSKSHFFSSSGVLLNRELWRKAGNFDAVSWGHQVDTEFWIRICQFGPVAIIKQPLVFHRIHKNQETYKWKKVYEFEFLPFIRLLDYYIYDKGFKRLVNPDSLAKFECFRNKEIMRISRNYLLKKDINSVINIVSNNKNIIEVTFFYDFFNNGKKYALKKITFNCLFHFLKNGKCSLFNILLIQLFDSLD